MQIHYWEDEIFVELDGRNTPTITIKGGDFSFEFEGSYYGLSLYTHTLSMYDLCCLLALYKEYIESNG